MNIPLPIFLILLTLAGALVFYTLLPAALNDNNRKKYAGKLAEAYLAVILWWKTATRNGTQLGGYVSTNVSYWISPNMCSYVVGTWIDAVGAVTGTVVKQCNAADQTPVIYVPLSAVFPSHTNSLKGFYLTSIDLYYAVTTAALDAAGAIALIDRFVLPANAAAFPALVAHAFTYDAGNDTAAESDDLDEHTMTLNITTPFWVDNDDLVQVRLTLDAAATSVIRFHGARVNGTLKL